MKIEGEKFKLFIGGEEVAEGVVPNCDLNSLEHEKETPNFKALSSWSGECNINSNSIADFERELRLEEVKRLTDNYNRIMRIKRKRDD